MSEQRNRVNMHFKLTTVSSKPVEPGKTHLLTPLDQATGQHSLHLVFYYEKNSFGSFDLDPLRVSLSKTLLLYPSVMGRLIRGEPGNWEVKCNDAGVGVLRAKTWTEVHRQEAITNPPVFSSALHGRAVPNTDTKSAKYYVTMSIAQAPLVKMASTTFKFSNLVIKQCLSEIHVNCPDATPFDLLAAIFWMSVAHLKVPKHEHTHSLSICIDFKRLLKEPLPYGYFGNALHFSLLSLGEKDMIPDELGHVVDVVHGHSVGIKEDKILSVVDWLESEKGEGGRYAPPFRMYGPELTCVNMEHMINGDRSLIYAAMFEDNVQPAYVACHVENVDGEGLIMVMPSPEEGLARTVMVTLPKEEMVKLCEDKAILRLEPTMLLSGGL
ncbi:hypothetical protein CRYUN_Cryun05aG0024800 [Craigia yunnanensis]